YPTYKWGVEGDTPSFLHLMPNGLNNPDEPEQVGWGGYHTYALSPDSLTYAWTNWQQPQKDISDAYEKRFYPDEFNDFAARMAWAEKGSGNTNPVVIINGSKGVQPLVITVRAGESVKLSASKSYDAEGDNISFHWWQQKEIGVPVELSSSTSPVVHITVPKTAAGKQLHFICEVHDDGDFSLVSYRRVIMCVR
ncbi:MAG: DUF1593 domain-containing protein, partial [Bacteroidaceae bacterium]|nr:DUF1593 domain-containing protein [Bacteroidaceae bacterium]